MRNHRRPLVKGAGGGIEIRQHNGNVFHYRRSAASVNAAAFDRLTARIILERFRDGTLDIAILEALLLAVGLEA